MPWYNPTPAVLAHQGLGRLGIDMHEGVVVLEQYTCLIRFPQTGSLLAEGPTNNSQLLAGAAIDANVTVWI